MKRVAALLAVIMVAMFVLVGCGEEQSAEIVDTTPTASAEATPRATEMVVPTESVAAPSQTEEKRTQLAYHDAVMKDGTPLIIQIYKVDETGEVEATFFWAFSDEATPEECGTRVVLSKVILTDVLGLKNGIITALGGEGSDAFSILVHDGEFGFAMGGEGWFDGELDQELASKDLEIILPLLEGDGDIIAEQTGSSKDEKAGQNTIQENEESDIEEAVVPSAGKDTPKRTAGAEKTKSPIKNEAPTKTKAPVKTEAPTKTKAPVKTEAPTKTKAPVKTEEPKQTKKPVSSDQASTNNENSSDAVRAAKNYLGVMAFSRKGLIEQLEYEGFSAKEAAYGADNSGANWNQQAVKKAKAYLDVTAFSREGLIEQLKYDGFTSSQAKHGVDKSGANWNQQAAKRAKEYLNIMDMSRDRLIDQLKYDGFTSSQAKYGADAVGA